MDRFVSPETRVLTLPNGDTLVVKKRLNRGEQAEVFEHLRSATGSSAGLSVVLGYLVDWQLQEKNTPLLHLTWPEKTLVLNAMDPEDFIEVRNTIEAHIERVQAERDAAKKALAGATPSPATSPSPSSSAGATSGSAISTLTSTTSP